MAVTVAEPTGVAGDATPEVVKPPPGNPRFPLLDSVRAVAALAIVVTHVTYLSGFNGKRGGSVAARLDSGVTLFFILSGFLLYRPFVSARLDDRRRPRVRDYARRRFLRIVPAYWVALTVLSIWPGLPDVWHAPWRYYFFLQWMHGWSDVQGLGVAWSLNVEVMFYVALPFYALGVARWLGGRARSRQLWLELGLIGALAVASVASRQIVHGSGNSVYQQTLPAFLYWFGLGMSMAVISAYLHGRAPSEQPRAVRFIARRPWVPWLAAGVILWLTSTQFGLPREIADYTGFKWFIEHVSYGLFAALFVLPAVFGTEGGGWPRRLLANRHLAWVGLISYGIFLYHQPLIPRLIDHGALNWLSPLPGTVAVLAITTAIAGTLATASYYIVERPILRFKEKPLLRRRTTQPAPPSAATAPEG